MNGPGGAGDAAPPPAPLTARDWLRVVARGTAITLVLYGGLVLLLLLRLVEWPLFRLRRPVTPHVTQLVCRLVLAILGLQLRTTGVPLRQRGAMVANHAGWLDILVLNAVQRLYFVSKSEVARWPGIGWLARATGTLFIERKGSQALAQRHLFEARLRAGHRLLFFPEGTSTDSRQVLPFKSTLFAAFFTPGLAEIMTIQPVTVDYTAPPGRDARFYGWWGDMDLGPHLLQVLAAPRQGSVTVTWHPPVRVVDFADRKALAAHCEAVVRSRLTPA